VDSRSTNARCKAGELPALPNEKCIGRNQQPSRFLACQLFEYQLDIAFVAGGEYLGATPNPANGIACVLCAGGSAWILRID
jgi:hypothetical protein